MAISKDKIRFSIILDKELLEKLDDYCKITGVSRSSAIAITLADKFTQNEIVSKLPQMLQMANDLGILKT